MCIYIHIYIYMYTKTSARQINFHEVFMKECGVVAPLIPPTVFAPPLGPSLLLLVPANIHYSDLR